MASEVPEGWSSEELLLAAALWFNLLPFPSHPYLPVLRSFPPGMISNIHKLASVLASEEPNPRQPQWLEAGGTDCSIFAGPATKLQAPHADGALPVCFLWNKDEQGKEA